jgi:hypothetical protein
VNFGHENGLAKSPLDRSGVAEPPKGVAVGLLIFESISVLVNDGQASLIGFKSKLCCLDLALQQRPKDNGRYVKNY